MFPGDSLIVINLHVFHSNNSETKHSIMIEMAGELYTKPLILINSAIFFSTYGDLKGVRYLEVISYSNS